MSTDRCFGSDISACLQGTLPLDWGYLDSLSFANLSANNLTGTVMPLEWSEGLQGLSELWLGNNSLAGSIPRCRMQPNAWRL